MIQWSLKLMLFYMLSHSKVIFVLHWEWPSLVGKGKLLGSSIDLKEFLPQLDQQIVLKTKRKPTVPKQRCMSQCYQGIHWHCKYLIGLKHTWSIFKRFIHNTFLHIFTHRDSLRARTKPATWIAPTPRPWMARPMTVTSKILKLTDRLVTSNIH
jgi:hypothetical protein